MIENFHCNTLLLLFHNFTLGCVLPYRLLICELDRWNSKKLFFVYQRKYEQKLTNTQRRIFLEECVKKKIIPNFVKFRVPKNGCFKNSSVRGFQKNLLKKEVHACVDKQAKLDDAVDKAREDLKCSIHENLLPSICHHVSSTTKKLIEQLKAKHKRKIENLSAIQDSSLLNTKGYLTVLNDVEVPDCVKSCLRY